MTERWEPIPGYDGVYSVSDHGRVRRELTVTRAKAGYILKPIPTRDGYLQVYLSTGGKGRTLRIHRLVYVAFAGPIHEGLVINHINGSKIDNRLENLEAITVQANVLHAFRVLGRRPTGEKLTAEAVVEIRTKRAAGMKLKDLAREYDVTAACILSVATGKTWKHAGGPIVAARKLRQTSHQALAVCPPEMVAEAVRRYRTGESPTALAREYGVSRRTIYNWLEGKTRFPAQ